MNVGYNLIMILVMDIITLLLRAFPFLVFNGNRKTPAYVLYIGKVLPFSVMAMLVVYCLRNVNFLAAPHGVPEAIAILFTALLHIWRRDSLLSIGLGTALYMWLVQSVF